MPKTYRSALGHSSKLHPHRSIWVRWNNKRGISLEDNPELGMYEPWRSLDGGYERFFIYLSNLPRFHEDGRHDLEIDRTRDEFGKMHGYAPGWIRWADDIEQSNNRKSVRKVADGTPLHEAAVRNGLDGRTSTARVRSGHDAETAATAPLGMKLRYVTEAKDTLLVFWASTGTLEAAHDGRLVDRFAFAPVLCWQDEEGYFLGAVPSWVQRRFSKEHQQPVRPKKINFRAHRMLGIIWFGPPENAILSTDHINGNPADNARGNLRGWLSPKEQMMNRRQRGSRVIPIPRVQYNNPKCYEDMLIHAPQMPITATPPTYADIPLAFEFINTCREQIRQSCVGDEQLLSVLLLSAPSNQVRLESDGTLTTLVQNLNTKQVHRVRFACEGSGERQISARDKVFLVCPKCYYETRDGRPEIADRLPGPRKHSQQCKVCESVGTVSPEIAALLIHDPRTGEAPVHPFILPACTAKTYAWLRCSVAGCMSPAGLGGPMSIKQCVARAANNLLPVCAIHRERAKHFKGG